MGMISKDLWPTTIHQVQFSDAERMFILNACLLTAPEDLISTDTFDIIKERLVELGTVTFKNAWLGKTESSNFDNSFELHSDSHNCTDFIGVLWLAGNEQCGGNLSLYDPAWRNPQKPRNENSPVHTNKHTLEFELGTLTVFPANVWHEVSNYFGIKTRYSLNLALDIDGPNN